MSRLTERKKDRYGNEYIATCGGAYFEDESVYKALEKLAHYEGLEEQGRLIVQKQGQWIHEDVDWVCSECGEDAPTIPFKGKQYRANYCSNCGAKMG